MGQVDIRLRRNTDYKVFSTIVSYMVKGKSKIPSKIRLQIEAKIGHKNVMGYKFIDVARACKMYDTHELVDF